MNVVDRHDDVSGVPAHRFTKLSERLRVLQRRGALTFAQWGLATWLTANADRETHKWVGKLRTLKDETGWKQRQQQLRNDLKALRKLRLIDFETEERSKRPWVIELTGLHAPPSPERLSKASANETGVPRLHTDGAGLQSESSASPQGEPPSGASEPEPFAQRPSNSLSMSERRRTGLRGPRESSAVEEQAEEQSAREFAATDDEAFCAALERVRAARAEAFLEDDRGPRTAPSLA